MMKPNVKEVVANLKQSMPFRRKLWLFVKNVSIRITKFQTCCGHPGEPGC